ncbi:alcohol oxidase p68, partial [Aureobasidium melanogenum]
MLNTRSDVVFSRISLGRCQIHVHGACRTVVGVEGMHGSYFAGISVHASSGLAGLDVTPDHGCHVAFVVHEASVKVGGVVGGGRGYVGEASAEGVLEEVEHGEKLSGGHQHVVSEPSGDDTIMHHGFRNGRQQCEERGKRAMISSDAKGLTSGAFLNMCLIVLWLDGNSPRPFVHLSKFILIRPNFDTSFDTIGSQRTSTIDIPLFVDCLLNSRITTNKVIERLDMRLSSED